jgi:choice-of-anchor B domain-containing protein
MANRIRLALMCLALLSPLLLAHGPAPPLSIPKGSDSAEGSDNTRLLANLNQHAFYNDVSGYHSPSGVELAIIGTDLGTAFVDATNPRQPREIAFVNGPVSKWREMDVLGDYLYVVTEGGGGMQIFDLSNPLDPQLVKTWGDQIWSHAHTIHIDRTAGNAYINGTNAGMVIASLADPVNPVLITTFTDDYVHDCFVQDGIAHLAHIHTGLYRTLDVHNLPTLVTLDLKPTPGHATHSASVTRDNRVAVLADEVAQGHLSLWDCSDPANLRRLSEFTTGTGSIAHNPYVIGSIVHTSWYTDGYVAVDIADPSHPKKLASYDTFFGGSGGFKGTWSCYPYQPSGAIYLGDTLQGLFIIEVKCYPAVPYGAGLAGSGGFTPALASEEFASIGNASFHVEATNLYGGLPGVLLVGFGRASLPFYGGTLLVDLSPFFVRSFLAHGPASPGAGDATLPLPIPADTTLVGLTIDMQIAQSDPGAVRGVSLSNGLEVVVCDPN